MIMAAAARSSGTTEGTLKLWRTDPDAGGPVLTARRPVGWTLPAWFPLSSLQPGSYTYTLSAHGQVVGGGIVQTQCTGSDGNYTASACTTGNAAGTAPTFANWTPPG
jgi:hypothetical protein